VYTSGEPVGVELARALKNVIAPRGGHLDGLGLRHNAKAALLTRGIVEMRGLGLRGGARRDTFFGLSGVGDLITRRRSRRAGTCPSAARSRRGKNSTTCFGSMNAVAGRGVDDQKRACLAKRHGVDMPINRELHRILYEG